jgi:hypothetical protein
MHKGRIQHLMQTSTISNCEQNCQNVFFQSRLNVVIHVSKIEKQNIYNKYVIIPVKHFIRGLIVVEIKGGLKLSPKMRLSLAIGTDLSPKL